MESSLEPDIDQTSLELHLNTPDIEEESVSKEKEEIKKPDVSVVKKKERIDYYKNKISQESSQTKFYKKPRTGNEFKVVNREEFLSISESVSGSSDTFNCVHGIEGKKYSQKGLLKRNIRKNLDAVPIDPKWDSECPPTYEWDIASKLEFVVTSPTAEQQVDRIQAHLRDFNIISSKGYRVDVLGSICTIADYLIESIHKQPVLKEGLQLLLQSMNKPLLLNVASDVVKYFDVISHYLGFLGYLLIRIDDDEQFDIVANAILWQLSAPDSLRGPGTVHLRHALAAAAPVLNQSVVRMIAVTSSKRFPVFLEIALILACDTADNCIAMMRENIIENIFYRFDPYFPERPLPNYEINPYDCQDYNVKLGDSTKNMSTTLSLLLVLVKTTKQYLDENLKQRLLLPHPDFYAQRCFIWAYRYECRAREHRHERMTLTVIADVLLRCFGDRLLFFSSVLMPDIMSLSVLTELPPRNDWVGTVNFNAGQQDVQFKKILIHFVVDLLKVFPYNKFMLESRYWLVGIMYLLDPGLCRLRCHWSPPLFAEIRITALQALVCTLSLADHTLVRQYGLIRRIMWYIEWYSEQPYEIRVLYWCMRVLQVTTFHRTDTERETTIIDLFDTHGIIILINLCYTLLEQKLPPMEKSQAVIALALRLLTSAVNANRRVVCTVYPTIKWPASVNAFATKMLDVVLYSLDKHFIISDRWLVSLLNFIWEAIIWRKDYRELFFARDGIYKLLDLVTMTSPSVQCLALALVCDVARAGDAVGQLVTWRANLGASNAYPNVVSRGATIASLLAAVFRDCCLATGVRLNEYGVIQDLDNPIMSLEAQNELSNRNFSFLKGHQHVTCLAAADLAGSRMSKAFAILHLLSEDLEEKVSLADEAYSLYKNIQLAVEDEVVLVLCSHYLTLKLNEVWKETKAQSIGMVKRDDYIIDDFVNIGKGWSKEIKRQQEDVLARDRKKVTDNMLRKTVVGRKEHDKESSLYAFLGRIRLNIALDALQAVRCVARSTDRNRITHDLLRDAVFAHHRRFNYSDKNNAPILKTYKPMLDDQNVVGQNVTVASISTKQKSKLHNLSQANSDDIV